MPSQREAESFFDLDDDIDAQWFAWGVYDGRWGKRRSAPERDGVESDYALGLRRKSYEAGLAAGEVLR